MNPDLRHIASLTGDLMFTKPVVNTDVEQYATAMGVDVNAIVVRPEFAWTERFVCYCVHYISEVGRWDSVISKQLCSDAAERHAATASPRPKQCRH